MSYNFKATLGWIRRKTLYTIKKAVMTNLLAQQNLFGIWKAKGKQLGERLDDVFNRPIELEIKLQK